MSWNLQKGVLLLPAMHKRKKTSILTVMVSLGTLLIFLVAIWKWYHPTYRGHGMEHWFNVYAEDGVREDPRKPNPPLSPAQEEALNAFQHFGKKGLVYLIDLAIQDYEPTNIVKTIESFLEIFPWNSRYNFELGRYYQIRTATGLLTQLGIPFDVAQLHYNEYADSSDPEKLAKGLMPYQWATNNFEIIGETAVRYINHESQKVKWHAGQALANIAHNSEIEPQEWSDKLPYSLLAGWAAKSDAIKEQLISHSQSSMPNESFKAFACLVTAFPNSETYHEQLLRSITIMPNESGAGFGTKLYFLISIRFPFQTIYTNLIDAAQKSDFALFYVAELLLDHGLDVSPLLPRFEEVIAAPANKYQHAHPHLTASLFLLQQDLHNSEVWAFIDQVSGGTIPTIPAGSLQDQFIGVIQALAPYCKEAQAILDKNPASAKRLPMPKVSAANFRLRQHRLPPFNEALSPIKHSE